MSNKKKYTMIGATVLHVVSILVLGVLGFLVESDNSKAGNVHTGGRIVTAFVFIIGMICIITEGMKTSKSESHLYNRLIIALFGCMSFIALLNDSMTALVLNGDLTGGKTAAFKGAFWATAIVTVFHAVLVCSIGLHSTEELATE
ncbi:hypothetical protein BX661DRAFT_179386 [Kickxella alabastrina]|uniref:uncharacterized protein n=1 Tax=Kickxella alabastrina TaxID=61397 RepID=UPI0022206629|nr:uncharacterized protein BX661DRAFT_179386 [Kickxella alabastrina]KAI7831855.1 hypothetical protein BX661DRAFT_179386 [Kickxella alabastrina]